MPITTQFPVKTFDQASFHRVDEQATGLAFNIHNEVGRYLGEKLYQNELARRCSESGFHVTREFGIVASLDNFEKAYSADLMIQRGVIVETKTVSTLTDVHKGQTLNYLFMCGLHHGTLLNFRSERVEHEFVSTQLTHKLRRQYKFVLEQWIELTSECMRLRVILDRCLNEWGAFLDPLLYRDAITHFLGGKESVVKKVPITSNGMEIGVQEMRLLTDDIAFSVTASTHRPGAVFDHQLRFLKHTPLRAIQWINLNHGNIELRTIQE